MMLLLLLLPIAITRERGIEVDRRYIQINCPANVVKCCANVNANDYVCVRRASCDAGSFDFVGLLEQESI